MRPKARQRWADRTPQQRRKLMKSNELESRVVEGLLEGLLSSEPDVGIEELEQRASIGCSVSARALVNTRETFVELAAAAGAEAEPSASLRDRVLAAAKPPQQDVAGAAPESAVDTPSRVDPRSEVPDSSERVAQIHIENEAKGLQQEDRARIQEVEALAAHVSHRDDRFDRVLAELSALLPYRVFLIAVVHGEWVHHRAVRGVPEALGDFRQVSRTGTFCTHCVSSGHPFRVENAAAEPFFRGNRMVWEYGARAYAGAPLRTSNDVVFGTVCALHDEPRSVPPTHLALLAHYARRVAAEMERRREPSWRAQIVDRTIETPDGTQEVTTDAWFRGLLDLVLALRGSRDDAPDAGMPTAYLEVVEDEKTLLDRWSTVPRGAVVARRAAEAPGLVVLTTYPSEEAPTAPPWAVSGAELDRAEAWLEAAGRRSV